MIRKLFFFLLFVIILLCAAYYGLTVYVATKGKAQLEEAILDNYGIEASIGRVELIFPFTLEAGDISCKDLSIKRIYVAPLIPDFKNSCINISSLRVEGFKGMLVKDEQGFYLSPFKKVLEQEPSVSSQVQEPLDSVQQEPQPEAAEQKKKVCYHINRFQVIDSAFTVLISNLKEPLTISFNDVESEFKNVSIPELSRFDLTLNASLSLKEGKFLMDDFLDVSGWVDYSKKNMDVELAAKNYDYFALSEYYPKNFKPDVYNLKEAIMSLDADLESVDNVLVINAFLSMDSAVFDQVESGERTSRMKILKTVLKVLRDESGRSKLPITITTQMDNPAMDSSRIFQSLQTMLPITPGFVAGHFVNKAEDSLRGNAQNIKDLSVDLPLETLKKTIGIFSDLFKTQKEEEEEIIEEQEEHLKDSMRSF